jgi:2-(3-amino-3-carboxypropyl)histidine synthase
MEHKTISELEREYVLELEKIVKTIKKQKAKKVLLQFPDGLKPYSTVIAEEIERQTNAECLIWLGTCFGACDVPIQTEKLGVDLIIQFGHSPWKFGKEIKVI